MSSAGDSSAKKRASVALLCLFALALLAIVVVRSRRGSPMTTAAVAHDSIGERAPRALDAPGGPLESAPAAIAAERTVDADRAVPEPPAESVAAVVDPLVGCTVHGRVLDAEGHPIPVWRPYVSATDAAGVRRNTDASDEGLYSLTGLAPGEWTLHVGAVGYRNHEEPLALDAAVPVVRRDVVLARAVRLAVRFVTPEGEPLYATEAGKRLGEASPFPVATVEAPGATIPEALRGGADLCGVGSFWQYGPLWEAAGPGCAGVLVLAVELPVFVSLTVGSRVLESRWIEPGTEAVTFVVSPERLLGELSSVEARIVAGDSRAPLAAQVGIEPLNKSDRVADGHWQRALPPGTHDVTFSAPGYARIQRQLALAPGQRLDLGEIVLPPELVIEGRLLDDEGRPVAGMVRLAWRDATGGLSYDFARSSVPTDEHGAFRIDGLLAGHYLVRTVASDEVNFPGRENPPPKWVSGLVPVSTLGGSVRGLDLHLVRAGTLVLSGTGGLPAGARFRVLDANGDLVRHVGLCSGFVTSFGLPPGAYTLVVCDEDGNELGLHAVEIGAGVMELDLSR
jgi:protocatechuate 3,4-dioxygenase beta subunit